jgi:hypothetical protein
LVKTTIDIPDGVWKKFSIKVIEDFGGRKKNDIIQSLIGFYLTAHNGVVCKKCFHTIDLTEVEPQGGIKSDWGGSMITDRTKGEAFKVTCPFCSQTIRYQMHDVRPIHPDLTEKPVQPTHE